MRDYIPEVGYQYDEANLEKLITVHEVTRNPRSQFGFFMQEKFTFVPIRVVKLIYMDYCNYCKQMEQKNDTPSALREFIKERKLEIIRKNSIYSIKEEVRQAKDQPKYAASYKLGTGFSYDG